MYSKRYLTKFQAIFFTPEELNFKAFFGAKSFFSDLLKFFKVLQAILKTSFL